MTVTTFHIYFKVGISTYECLGLKLHKHVSGILWLVVIMYFQMSENVLLL